MRRAAKWILTGLIVVVLATAVSPWLVAAYWRTRSSNPVRRGVHKAAQLGCFHCHGELGQAGIPDPGGDEGDLPAWSGGVWMMYVENEAEIRDFILNGSRPQTADPDTALHDHEHPAIAMPAYKDVLRGGDLDDLVAAFKVLSGMTGPEAGTPARRGFELARRWRCFSCHGPAGSGGLSNPRSLTGFIPGWYGPDFEDLVRDRAEFDAWILDGASDRLQRNPVAAFFMRRQRVSMPSYAGLRPADLDALWAHTRWLAETEGGSKAPVRGSW